MKSPVIKRTVYVNGRKTGICLEDAFWSTLKEIAHAQGATGSVYLRARSLWTKLVCTNPIVSDDSHPLPPKAIVLLSIGGHREGTVAELPLIHS
jgi:Ribbon-helix-helix domain